MPGIESAPGAKIAYRMLVNSWRPGDPAGQTRAKRERERERRVIKYVSRYTESCLSLRLSHTYVWYTYVCGRAVLSSGYIRSIFLPNYTLHLAPRYFVSDPEERSRGLGSTWASMLSELKFKRLRRDLRRIIEEVGDLKVLAWLCHRLTLDE